MKKQLFLMLVLYVTSMQVAIAGVRAEADTAADSKTLGNVDPNAKELTEDETTAAAGLVYDLGVKSWSPEDSDSPEFRTKELGDGYTEVTKVEKRTSSGSSPIEEVLSTGRTCMSAKCNPSKNSEKDSGDNKQGTGGQGPDANDQAVQQITNNNNNAANKLANDAANTVVVPPPPPLGCPPICAPPPPPPPPFCVVGVDPGCI